MVMARILRRPVPIVLIMLDLLAWPIRRHNDGDIMARMYGMIRGNCRYVPHLVVGGWWLLITIVAAAAARSCLRLEHAWHDQEASAGMYRTWWSVAVGGF